MQTFPLRLLLALSVLAFPAFAADAPPTPEPSISGLIFQGLIGLASLALTTLLSVASVAIRSRTKDARFGSLINQLWVLVQSAVAHAEAEIRPMLQTALADGKLTPEEGAALKAKVIEVLRTTAADQLGQLVKAFGLPEGAISTLLSGLVERAVALLKESPAPSPAVPAPAPAPAPASPQ
ncbi:MAG: hypothetical protein ACOZQL_10575 [Myxococcota bacterium]